MIKNIKIRLKPTIEQENLFRQSCGVKRFAYNWGLNRANELYLQGMKFNKFQIKKEFNQYKKQFDWINKVSSQISVDAFNNLEMAFKMYFNGLCNKPKLKSKKTDKMSFYVTYNGIVFKDNMVHIPKIGKIKYVSGYKIPQLNKYINPHCSFDGKYWYLSFGVEYDNQVFKHNNESVGIDLGIRHLAIISNQEQPIKNINKSKKIKYLNKKLIRKQRQVSKKYEMNKQGNKYIKTNNILRLEDEIRLIYRKIRNIQDNHIYQTIATIIKSNPNRIVMEDLNVSGMMKNKHISKAVQEQKFYKFITTMKYKCECNNIEFIKADRWFPSSKTCSCCGNIKKDLKLKDRIYKCNECGLIIDRDKNAAINLSMYKLIEKN